jgi:hypothetical protein
MCALYFELFPKHEWLCGSLLQSGNKNDSSINIFTLKLILTD